MYRYGVDKSRIGVIGSVCIIPGSIDVDGLNIKFNKKEKSLLRRNRISNADVYLSVFRSE